MQHHASSCTLEKITAKERNAPWVVASVCERTEMKAVFFRCNSSHCGGSALSYTRWGRRVIGGGVRLIDGSTKRNNELFLIGSAYPPLQRIFVAGGGRVPICQETCCQMKYILC